MKTIAEKIEIMRAFERGEDIEFIRTRSGEWKEWLDAPKKPDWNWEDYDYRIKDCRTPWQREVEEAWKNGEIIEHRRRGSDIKTWTVVKYPHWFWDNFEYRIKIGWKETVKRYFIDGIFHDISMSAKKYHKYKEYIGEEIDFISGKISNGWLDGIWNFKNPKFEGHAAKYFGVGDNLTLHLTTKESVIEEDDWVEIIDEHGNPCKIWLGGFYHAGIEQCFCGHRMFFHEGGGKSIYSKTYSTYLEAECDWNKLLKRYLGAECDWNKLLKRENVCKESFQMVPAVREYLKNKMEELAKLEKAEKRLKEEIKRREDIEKERTRNVEEMDRLTKEIFELKRESGINF